MTTKLKFPSFVEKRIKEKLLLCLVAFGFLTGIGFFPTFGSENQGVGLILVSEDLNKSATIEGNSLLPIAEISFPRSEPQIVQRIKVVVTAYSSTPCQTDDDPFITAAGTRVREGIVANNLLVFGTKVRMPELFGDRIFVVEDRMNCRKGPYHVDIWFPSYWEALNFGARITYLEILEN